MDTPRKLSKNHEPIVIYKQFEGDSASNRCKITSARLVHIGGPQKSFLIPRCGTRMSHSVLKPKLSENICNLIILQYSP